MSSANRYFIRLQMSLDAGCFRHVERTNDVDSKSSSLLQIP